VPDVIASAGGIIHAVCREELGCDEQETSARIAAIGDQVTRILAHASSHGIAPLRAAHALTSQPRSAPAR
jgi:leucine dehydrogenase